MEVISRQLLSKHLRGQTHFYGQKLCVFILSLCFDGQNTLHFGKHTHILNSCSQFIFHGQNTLPFWQS